jgi:lysyl-tRNA synthetase class 2
MSELIDARRAKIEIWKQHGFSLNAAYRGNLDSTLDVRAQIEEYRSGHLGLESQFVAEGKPQLMLAGRVMLSRGQGKLRFMQLRDSAGEIQLFISKQFFTEEQWNLLKTIDLGDIIEVSGIPMVTSTGEDSLQVRSLRPLVKALIPPNKHDTVTDVEARYRHRYVDLIENKGVMRVFKARSAIISGIRSYLMGLDFMEVETPTLVPLRSGATALPFETHHNALDANLFLRVAPELYLKRCVVGGMNKVFEIGKSFRNEGTSTRHNPEFTMVEAYEAFANYETAMDRIKTLFIGLSGVVDHSFPEFADRPFTLVEWADITMVDAVANALLRRGETDLFSAFNNGRWAELQEQSPKGCDTPGKIMYHLFETYTEPHLATDYMFDGKSMPVFIRDFPVEVSPLAQPFEPVLNYKPGIELTRRFELFIDGKEIANGFCELNDPAVQLERFKEQVVNRANGDAEAMDIDEDYIQALSYGLAPSVGWGCGIDRICMLLTNQKSIRDVILFPAMRKQ